MRRTHGNSEVGDVRCSVFFSAVLSRMVSFVRWRCKRQYQAWAKIVQRNLQRNKWQGSGLDSRPPNPMQNLPIDAETLLVIRKETARI